MYQVDSVEAHISPWANQGSNILTWAVWATPGQDESERVAVGSGGGERKVFELYKPDMEAGHTENVFDGTTTYTLSASGIGDWKVKLRIKAKLTSSTTGLVMLKSGVVSADLFLSTKDGKELPLPAGDNAFVQVYFEHS